MGVQCTEQGRDPGLLQAPFKHVDVTDANTRYDPARAVRGAILERLDVQLQAMAERHRSWLGAAHPPARCRLAVTFSDSCSGGENVQGGAHTGGECPRYDQNSEIVHCPIMPERRRIGHLCAIGGSWSNSTSTFAKVFSHA
ncbi:hypothetical protein D3C78_988740 [compost metagenome]